MKEKKIISKIVASIKEELSRTPVEQRWITEEEAMRIMNIRSPKVMRRMAKQGKFKAAKLGRTYRYNIESIENLITNSVI